MRYCKKISSFASVFLLVSIICQLNVNAETYFASEDFKYTYRYDGTISVAGYLGTSSNLNIPDTISGENVTEISWNAFNGNKSIESVSFPDTLKIIGDSSFANCISLKSIVIPYSVTKIVANAFYSCTAASVIEIKGNLESVEKYSFNRCSSVKEIVLPETVKSIGDYAFYGCSSLEYIYIPPSTTYIEKHAFDECGKLVIYGYSGSYAEVYAGEKNIDFVSVGEVESQRFSENKINSVQGSYNKFENNNAWDLNSDGIVNNLDFKVLCQFLVKTKNCFFGESNYDFNGDRKFNIADVTCLQIKISVISV